MDILGFGVAECFLSRPADPEPDVSLHLAAQQGRSPAAGSGSLDEALGSATQAEDGTGGDGSTPQGQQERQKPQ